MLVSHARRCFRAAATRTASARNASTVVLVRHGESTWNLANKFTGWYDCPLSENGHKEAAAAGELVNAEGYSFDVAYTSTLKRAIRTCYHTLEATDLLWIPTVKAWQLNERHYGGLQGMDKQECVDEHGLEQVTLWRRSYDIPPPALDDTSEHYPGNDTKCVLRCRRRRCAAAHPSSPPGTWTSPSRRCRSPSRSRPRPSG